MSKEAIPRLAQEFALNYDAAAKDEVWREQSGAFRTFWEDKILNHSSGAPTDEECDVVIRFLDRNAKGNTQKTEAVARAMIPQGAWRRMFAEFRSNSQLGSLVHRILVESDSSKKAGLIDQLYEVNAGKRNNLTGESGNAVNAMLAAFDPFKNVSVISLKDRRSLLEFLDSASLHSWETMSMGERMAQSNQFLVEGLKAAGVPGTARTKSVFCYWSPFKELWKAENTIKRPDKTVAVTVPTSPDVEEVKTEDIRESLRIQAMLAEIGARMGLKIWLPRSDVGSPGTELEFAL